MEGVLKGTAWYMNIDNVLAYVECMESSVLHNIISRFFINHKVRYTTLIFHQMRYESDLIRYEAISVHWVYSKLRVILNIVPKIFA